MGLNRRNPIWPYLLVLACLFGLSVAAPRGWQRSGGEDRSNDLANQRPLLKMENATTAEVIRPTSIVEVGPPLDGRAGRAASTLPETKAHLEESAEKIGERWQFPVAAESTVGPDNPMSSEQRQPIELDGQPNPFPNDFHLDSVGETGAASHPSHSADISSESPTQPIAIAATNATAPPAASATPDTTSSQSGQAITTAKPQAEVPQAVPQTEEEPQSPPVEQYAPEHQPEPPVATAPEQQPVPATPPKLSGWPLPENLLARLRVFRQYESGRDWADRVQAEIEQLDQLGPEECDPAPKVFERLRRLVKEAESLVPNLPNSTATADLRRLQYAIVRRVDIWEQVCTIRRRTASSVVAEGTEGLLAAMERYETDGLTSDAHHLAEIRRELEASPEPDELELARRLNVHYRNANLRIAVTATLVDRLLPDPKPSNDQVNETILGNPVRGGSTTSTKLSVRLVPDPRNWRFDLVAAGTVGSQTRTTHGPVTFVNSGDATYQVRKRVVIDTDGVRMTSAIAEVDNSSELEGLYTSFDSIPIIRSLVRNYAMSQEEQSRDEADREAKEKIAAKAMRRVDAEADPKLAAAQDKFNRDWLEPLRKLSLDPAAPAMETTDSRLVLRSRLAGGDQLGANTPRPEAPSGSLASAQVHESTINNLLDHLDLTGRTFTLPELHKWLAEKLGRGETKDPQDLPEGVHLTFAKNDPIRVRCDGNHLELILNIGEIRDGRRHWHDFEVRAAYRPVARGLAAQFEREGTIELGGQYKGKPEIALRGIFSKVLSRERKLNLLPPALAVDPRLAGLEVTQFVVEGGWIGTAIGPARSVAHQPTTTKR
ncbi:MAG TPA: hypothetical protein VGY55_18785 [Pirellulales bacterium]|jgi:hypothetical protein|nr:hypothetical protein [Pirellulales bacterium]